ncbi:MAG: hypothetical protein GF341_09480 [candidate division Zixibacteria bacterium]|nr:hypothetical protein [candidate division Zixibacteria bacterium]
MTIQVTAAWAGRCAVVSIIAVLFMSSCTDTTAPVESIEPSIEAPTMVIPHPVRAIQHEVIEGVDHIVTHDGRNVTVYSISKFPLLRETFRVNGRSLGDAEIHQISLRRSRYKYMRIAASTPHRCTLLVYRYVPPYRYVHRRLPGSIELNPALGRRTEYPFKVLNDILIGVVYEYGYMVADLSWSGNGMSTSLLNWWPPSLDVLAMTLTGGNLYVVAKVWDEHTYHIFRQNVYPLEEERIATVTEELAVQDIMTDSREVFAYLVGEAKIVRIDIKSGQSSCLEFNHHIQNAFVDRDGDWLYVNLPYHVAVVRLSDDGWGQAGSIMINNGEQAIVSITLDNETVYMLGSNSRIYRVSGPVR